jgi:hypothetical protein
LIGLAQGLTDSTELSHYPWLHGYYRQLVGPPWQRLELSQCKLSLALEDSGLDRHSGHGKTGNRWQFTMPRNRTTSNNKSVHILQTRSTEISVTRSGSTRKESSRASIPDTSPSSRPPEHQGALHVPMLKFFRGRGS